MRLACLIAAALLFAASARADSEKSRALYNEGVVLFRANRLREAIQKFAEGYAGGRDPAFLISIAECHRKLGEQDDPDKVDHMRQAVVYFRQFLAEAPRAKKKAEVLQAMDDLERRIAALTPKPVAPPIADEAPKKPLVISVSPPQRSSRHRWIAALVSGAALTAAAIGASGAWGYLDRHWRTACWLDKAGYPGRSLGDNCPGEYESIQASTAVAITGYAVGVPLMVVSAIMLVRSSRGGAHGAQAGLHVMPGPGDIGLSCALRF